MTNKMNRNLSFRSRREPPRQRFGISTFRGMQAPELSRKMTKLIKSENTAIGAHESAGRERTSIAAQLSEWGEATEDDNVSDISDKLGVMLAEIGEQEDSFAQNLEDYRSILKQIRNMEASVQPSREQRQKVTDEIAKLKYKDPSSPRLVTLEHELVRAEAQNLVAEAQLSNITRQKLKEAYDIHLTAVIERAEKQTILARHARRLLNYIDDTPVVPGDARQAYDHEPLARQILEDAENDLRGWESSVEPLITVTGRETPVHANGNDANGTSVNERDDVSDGQSDVLDHVSVAEGFTEPVGSGALPARMVVIEPSPA
ncbi:hypothetical protein DTO013E5_6855 [Penicillium roqueforti]|uniref:uncharacterized protein n=1 Tax=Penicillium roqueforti TaxID=5082 RepID=UPI0019095A93|nr:uncharacterized protein LCP9604111_8191 [Penicillium roqueforti]KAF9241918.1 hypothetical protein LCP9604111_8191 [Penicillium roqueforti]KAI2679788.1 hypothetical protein CBS147355_4270 [Penicillium roqueforti]KAI2684297.1 hypothetical protein LCP963914a_5597 [Penicillium roqueforti]KAI2697472.1 hypothetical protein CBS147372_7832 [Penicillium roqueforti]KAI2711172.1 hypothetical protein CBS147318_8209 [Penicillium roqueforti]